MTRRSGAVALATREATQRRAELVGRTSEIARIREALEGSHSRLFYVHGPGGIGKTSLLHAFAAEAERRAVPCVLVDARDLEPRRDAVLSALDAAGLGDGLRRLVLIDTYEHLLPIDADLCRDLFRRVRGATVVVVAGRAKPAAEWRAQALWGTDVVPLALRNLSPSEALLYLERRGVPDEMTDDIVAFSHGHPLALALTVDAFRHQPRRRFDPNEDPNTITALYRYFVQGVEAPERRSALEIAAVLRTTSETTLAVLLEGDVTVTFEWLRDLNFMAIGTRGVHPHDLTREVILAELRWRNPERLAALVLRAQRYHVELLQTRSGAEFLQIFDEFAYVIGHNPRLRMMMAHREGELVHDVLRDGDAELLEAAVARHEGPTSAGYLRHWVTRQPAAFGIVRDASSRAVAFAANVRLDLATDEERAADPIALSAWNHAVALIGGPPRGPLLYGRFTMACETHQAVSPALALAWRFGAPTLFLPGFTIGFTRFHEGRQWEALTTFSGSRYVPELAHQLDGRNYEVAIQDHRGLSAADWLTAMSERIALGDWREPPPRYVDLPASRLTEEVYARHVRRALRTLNDPLVLAKNPLVDSPALSALADEHATAHQRAEHLRRLLIDEIDGLRGTERGDRWHRVLDAAYVRGTDKHEVAARSLGMSYASFRRFLGAGTDHLVRALWKRNVAFSEG